MLNKSMVIALGLAYISIKKKRERTRTKYVREILRKRSQLGEFLLMKEMKEDAEYHFRYFRMSRDNFEKILELVGPLLVHRPNHETPIGPEERLAITIRYLASGSSQVSMGFNYRVSPASVSMILRETLLAIWDALGKLYVPSPMPESYKTSSLNYEKKWNFPKCVGSIDGKHVKIRAPFKTGSDYYNYKGYFSIVLLAVADPNYKFFYVDIGAKGSQSDSGIFSYSAFGKKLYTGTLALPPDEPLPNTAIKSPYVFFGDEGFLLKKNSMRPYPNKNITTEERIFNYRLCWARRIVENTFGMWAARFRIFYTTIHADLKLADLIVKATVVLHNYLMSKNDLGELTLDNETSGTIVEGSWMQIVRSDTAIENFTHCSSNNYSKTAADVREQLKNYFNSEQGMINWQYDAIHLT